MEKLIESCPDLYLLLDPQLNIVTASKSYLEATRTVLEQIRGRYIFEVFPDNPKSKKATGERNVKASFERVLKNKAADMMPVQKYDIPVPGKAGRFEVRYWSPLNSPVMGDDGEVAYILHRVEDVTAYKYLFEKEATVPFFFKSQIGKAMKNLEASEKRFAAIITIDSKSKIRVFNETAEKMFGYKAKEIIGKKLETLMPKRFRDAHASHIRVFGETNVTHRMMGRLGEIVGQRSDGEEFPIEASISQTGDGDNKFFSVIMRDVSEKRKIEAQFLRAQRMESIGRLAGGIAHDLNNILAPIMLSIGLLKTMIKDDKALEVLETIDVSSKRGADIVQQVLSFSRGIEGQVVEVQPRHLLSDLQTMLGETMPRGIVLSLKVTDGAWPVLGDPTQLHQILLNLSMNARDAMKEDGGELNITVENCKLDDNYVSMNKQARVGDFVVFTVTDSGCGIPLEVIDRIFEPFFTTKPVGEGSGIGLATVMAITKSHDGFVNVYSESGKGSTFKVYLPAASGATAADSARADDAAMPRGNGETVLIVDDEASILAITSQTLQAFGYKTLMASNGAAAVAVYAQSRKDIAVVLTDMMMPVMDGPATILAIRQINPKAKIIAGSGLDANGNVVSATEAGVNHFIKKPYTAIDLLTMIASLLTDKGEESADFENKPL